MDREEVIKFLGLMAEHFPSFQFSEDTANAWHMVLQEYSQEELLKSYRYFLQNSGSAFAPSAAQLIKSMHEDRMFTPEFWERLDKMKRGELND